MSLTLADVDNIAKSIYPQERLRALALAKRPLLNWFPKAQLLGGDGYKQSVWHEDPQSVGYNLATVIANKANAKLKRFFIEDEDFTGLYGAVGISGKALLGTRDTMFSYLKAKDIQVQGMMRQLGKVAHHSLYGDSNEYIGQASSLDNSSGDTVVTLTNAADVNKFGVGMVCVFDNDAAGGSISTYAAGTTEATVIARSRGAGTVTFSGDLTPGTHTDIAANDYIFTSGNQATTGSVVGLAGWLPLTAPSASDDHYGCDRSVDVERLAGFRLNLPGQDIFQSVTQLGTLIGEAEGNPDTCFMHPTAGNALSEEIGVKAELMNMEGKEVSSGYSGFVIPHFINGPLKVRFDWACPTNRCYLLTRRTWKLLHMGGLPHIVTDDGQMAKRGNTTDDIEIRGRLFMQPVCSAPGENGVCAIQL